ncbi:hypothetical protein DPEC_G00207940 [Dallia pectoralis]|uniref:Uncharacterized protein n=1 Tax=Dallia pectoralis TaxID=75939 RepID=A0ACC2G5J6_DALPE|nr:hypothetical protein DPEC_G00207940 [Dallia pectoralis]
MRLLGPPTAGLQSPKTLSAPKGDYLRAGPSQRVPAYPAYSVPKPSSPVFPSRPPSPVCQTQSPLTAYQCWRKLRTGLYPLPPIMAYLSQPLERGYCNE